MINRATAAISARSSAIRMRRIHFTRCRLREVPQKTQKSLRPSPVGAKVLGAMPSVTIDGRPVEFQPGQTIIRAALGVGIEIPYYCWHPRLSVAANCRMCLVEVEKAPKLLPACEAV